MIFLYERIEINHKHDHSSYYNDNKRKCIGHYEEFDLIQWQGNSYNKLKFQKGLKWKVRKSMRRRV